MGLVMKTCRGCDFNELAVSVAQFARCEVDSQAPSILPKRTAQVAAEHSRQVRWMYADLERYVAQAEFLPPGIVKQVDRKLHPAGRARPK